MKRAIPLLVILAVVGYFGYRAWEKANAERNNDLFYGTVEATEVLISAQAAGRIVELKVDEGDHVANGELLARIDDSPYLAQHAQAQASVRAARSQAAVVQANLAGLDTEINRTKKLLTTGSASEMQLDVLTTQRDSLKAQREAIRSQAATAEAAVAVVQTQLDNTQVAAPIDGTVLRRHVELGETVFPGSALLVLADLSTVQVYAYVPEPMLGAVRLGQTVLVFNDTHPAQPLEGKVVQIADRAQFTPKNVQTRDERVRLIYKIKIEVPNPDQTLKAGMPVDVRFK